MRYNFIALVLALATAASAEVPVPFRVVTTTGMIADAAQRVGGERVAVRALMGEGVDPHLYKASPGDMRLLSDADIILFNGLHLEGKMSDLLEKMAGRKKIYAVTDTIDRARLHQPPAFAGQFDPHVWFDVSLWIEVVKRVGAILADHDPAHAGEYAARRDTYIRELEELNRSVGDQIRAIPGRRRVLVTAHDAFGYFGSAYGMEVHGIQGISTESEASIRELNALVELIASRKVPAVFVESSVPRKMVEALVEGCRAKGHRIRIGGELFSDSLGSPHTPEGTYIGMVQHNVRVIAESLR